MELDTQTGPSAPPRPAPTVILGSRLLAELDKGMVAEGADAIVMLNDWNCCGRCILRLLCIRVSELYKQSELYIQYFIRDYVAKFGKSLPPIAQENLDAHSKKCSLCFGLLPHIALPTTSDELMGIIGKSGYQIEDYALRLRLPTSMMLRHWRAWSHLQQAFPASKLFAKSPISDSVVEVKEAIRWVFSQATFRKLRIEHKHRARLEIFVDITHEETKQEYKAIWPEMNEDDIKGSDDEKDNDVEEKPKQNDKKRKRGGKPVVVEQTPQRDGLGTVKAKLKTMKGSEILQLCPTFPTQVETLAKYDLQFSHLPLHVAGRYIKLSRQYSQTPWIIMGTDQRIGIGSVEEVIKDCIKDQFKADEIKFSTAGREDRDVRMLGRGRPFLLEFINPRKSRFGRAQYAEFQNIINKVAPDAVQVRDFQYVQPQAQTVIKTSQDTKLKNYQAVVWTADAISPEKVAEVLGAVTGEITLQQWTPVRVLHRRALALRERKIYKLSYEYVDEHHFKLDLVTQAGTYIKEFVHGDLGRTRPNIREMLNVSSADLLALDVTDVQVDFPAVLDPNFDPAASAPSIMIDLPKPGIRTVIVTEEDAE